MGIEIKDQLNRTIRFEASPKRIVSLVPSQSELLCDLGLEENVVGLTKFCVHPTYIKSKKKIVGGTKAIHIDRIKALKPDIILCNKEENTKDIVLDCESVAAVHVSDISTLDDSLELIGQYGELFNTTKKAQQLIDKITFEADSFKTFVENKPGLKTLYFIWKNPWMVAGKETFIDYLMSLNRFENLIKSERYPEIGLEKDKNVELVLLSSEPFPFKEAHKKELKEFYPKAKILLVDGEMFSWYGSRLTKAFQYFRQLHEHL